MDVDAHSIEVRREDLTRSGRRIDFTISTKSHLIGIEMKIDAGDQCNQLNDYYDELFFRAKNNERVSIFYLTLNGKEPSLYSLGKLPIEHINCISFDIHILTWLQKCVAQAPNESVVKQTLNQYLSLVEKLTHKNSLIPALSTEIAGSTEKMLAALSISEAVVYAQERIMRLFWNELNAKLISVGKKPEIYGGSNIDDICHAYFFKSKNHRNIGIRYCIYEDSFKSIWTYINVYSWLHYGLRCHDKNNQLCVNQELKLSVNNNVGVGNAVSAKDPNWLSCYYFDPEQGCPHPIAFEEYEKNESCTYVYFTQVENRTLRIEQLIQHIFRMESSFQSLFT
ncbi:PD-(D/E)XK nuclease family protein [Aeromonas veronii]